MCACVRTCACVGECEGGLWYMSVCVEGEGRGENIKNKTEGKEG